MQSLLQPGEQIRNMAFILRAPGIMLQILLVMVCGWILIFLMTKHYYAVLTDRRLILIQTGMGFFSPKMENRGVTSFDLANVKGTSAGGIANNRSFTLEMADGTSETFRIAPWSKAMSGQSRFLGEVSTLRSLPG